ncbi:MAG: hypothetical protein CO128_07315 [Ignavibacteriales bacterium CG_4_9_14_3_um_filter_30_11]|nr:MAG: hypothetical protein CO128_07315 [Ignavibacteriales bacterium CG_4_9_14_3_um_filter_30_11]
MKLFMSIILMVFTVIGCSNKNDVVKKESGLMFKDDTLGTGNVAKTGDFVSLHFRAWIIKDSTNIFTDWSKDTTRVKSRLGDSYVYDRPIKYILNEDGGFVKGATEGIVGLKEGGTRTIIIPSKLAYGETGFRTIPPNSDIKLVVELLAAHELVKVEPWKVDSTKYITTKSGLKYIVIEKGTGSVPDSGDVITLNYSGYLTNGKKFDSSVERGDPISYPFKMQRMIDGFQEGTAMMNKGSKYRLLIPAKLAYGERAMGEIPPNSDLMFDLEMVDIKKPETK